MNKAFAFINDDLAKIAEAQLYRSRKVVNSAQQTVVELDGRKVLNFCSNDYLGLANHPDVIKAFKQGVDQYGVGSGSAHLVCGHSRVHQQLEEELADFTGRDRVLLFSTGYMANLAVLTSLLNKRDAVFEDRLNHASLLDGGMYSGARFKRYLHLDTADLEQGLKQSVAKKRFIVSDGVFSMDGDIAPLDKLAQLAQTYQAGLMLDDAHGIGVLGEQGKGSVAHYDLSQNEVPVLMATLGKSFGTFGAFVAGSDALIEYLIQKARTYIYTTAMPPAVAAATRASLNLLQTESWRRQKLQTLLHVFKLGAQQLGIAVQESQTAIQPILIGDSQKAVQISQLLLQQGILVTAIRPPTVPPGQARLRITFSAEHEEADINKLLDILEQVLK